MPVNRLVFQCLCSPHLFVFFSMAPVEGFATNGVIQNSYPYRIVARPGHLDMELSQMKSRIWVETTPPSVSGDSLVGCTFPKRRQWYSKLFAGGLDSACRAFVRQHLNLPHKKTAVLL